MNAMHKQIIALQDEVRELESQLKFETRVLAIISIGVVVVSAILLSGIETW